MLKFASSVASIRAGKNLNCSSINPADNGKSVAFSVSTIENVPLTVLLRSGNHSSNWPNSLTESTSCPAISTGLGPSDLAVPFT